MFDKEVTDFHSRFIRDAGMCYEWDMTYTQHLICPGILICLLAIACGPDPLQPETRLPRGYGEIMLGDTFDPAGTGAKEITLEDGLRYFRIDRAEGQAPVLFRIDDSNVVVRIVWAEENVAEGRIKTVMRQAKERFGHFLQEETDLESGKMMIFEDEMTRYRLVFGKSQDVQISIRDLNSNF